MKDVNFILHFKLIYFRVNQLKMIKLIKDEKNVLIFFIYYLEINFFFTFFSILYWCWGTNKINGRERERVLRRQNLNLWEICGQSTVDRSHNNGDKPGWGKCKSTAILLVFYFILIKVGGKFFFFFCFYRSTSLDAVSSLPRRKKDYSFTHYSHNVIDVLCRRKTHTRDFM